jgi:hypothetical protein
MLCVLQVAIQCIMLHSKPSVKLAMLLLLSFLLYGAGNVHCYTVHENSEDLRALLDFHQSVNSDPNGDLSNWNTSVHFCHWNGVTCTQETLPWRVLFLNLSGQILGGQISNSVGNLTMLNYLDLSHNNFAGPMPILGRLQNLQYLLLNNNNLSGVIPDALANCSGLMYVYLTSNSLVGSISSKLGLLSNLNDLHLSLNLLVGSIPPELGLLFNLIQLNFSSNFLVGSIPPELGLLSNLISLDFSSNFLVGSIPPKLGRLSNLLKLNLSSNFLVVSILP